MHCKLGNWSAYSEWTNQNHSPPCGERYRNRIIIEEPKHGGNPCNSREHDTLLKETDGEPCPGTS